MVTVWFGVGQFLSGAMGQLYPGGDILYHILKKSQLKNVENFIYLLIVTMRLMLVNIDNSNFAVAEWHMNKE